MRRLWIILFISFLFSCTNSSESNLIIATSANMQFVMNEICEEFSNTFGKKCEMVISSSGKLTSQIIEGAPYHVFVSANLDYPNKIFEEGLAASNVKTYAKGRVSLWSKNKKIHSIGELTNDEIKKIAVANPKNAPYGSSTIELLKRAKIYEQVKDKMVFGESISQVNQFIYSNAVDAGFTAKSIALSNQLKDHGYWTDPDPNSYPLIQQGVIIINRNNGKMEESKQFLEFLFSPKSEQILNKYGYITSLENNSQ